MSSINSEDITLLEICDAGGFTLVQVHDPWVSPVPEVTVLRTGIASHSRAFLTSGGFVYLTVGSLGTDAALQLDNLALRAGDQFQLTPKINAPSADS